jgi:hypothetical protein
LLIRQLSVERQDSSFDTLLFEKLPTALDLVRSGQKGQHIAGVLLESPAHRLCDHLPDTLARLRK